MRFLVFLLTLMIPTIACALDFDSSLQSGTVEVNAQAAPPLPDISDTASLGLLRTDTNEQVFCTNAAPSALVSGVTSDIVNTGGPIFLEFFAYSLPNCTGLRSIASTNRYRVIFGAPGQPILLQVVGGLP